MCDTVVAVHPGEAVWLSKNSDREPGEAQALEVAPAGEVGRGIAPPAHGLGPPRWTALLSRPAWMWGAEIGVNERGVAIGNEAVFTRRAVGAQGLTGMDLVRAALGHATSAREAVDVITSLLARHPQGGRMGLRDAGFRYSSSFAIADAREAWILETAGALWAAARVPSGVRAISNALTIGREHDLAHFEVGAGCDFAATFGRRSYRALAGASLRRERHAHAVGDGRALADFARGVRCHVGHPLDGWRMTMPCAHASWEPTRAAGQTTATMVVRLDGGSTQAWATGTSSPCLSVLKPVDIDGHAIAGTPPTPVRADSESLWWRHERLHRAVLADYERRGAALEDDRARLEQRAIEAGERRDARAQRDVWEAHREVSSEWLARALAIDARAERPLAARWWRRQSQADGLAAAASDRDGGRADPGRVSRAAPSPRGRAKREDAA